MNIVKATRGYEAWLDLHTALVAEDVTKKHQAMASAPFPFLRATYYRWAQVIPQVCPKPMDAPSVLAVGDLHVENFGTWRDAEGRLAWGVNDFDEAHPLPYTNDLIRLAVSAVLAAEAGSLHLTASEICDAIQGGYAEVIGTPGRPFVLAEEHDWLREVAKTALLDPVAFWKKMTALPDAPRPIPESAIAALEATLPGGAGAREYAVKQRAAGLGSLGHPRYVALREFEGGQVAREAKALVPSGCVWAASLNAASGKKGDSGGGGVASNVGGGPAEIYYAAIVDRSVRCHDPFFTLSGHWIVRRLAPDCTRIELASLPAERDEARLLRDMGCETANIHRGSLNRASDRRALKLHLEGSRKGWLRAAAEAMAEATRKDWKAWSTAASST